MRTSFFRWVIVNLLVVGLAAPWALLPAAAQQQTQGQQKPPEKKPDQEYALSVEVPVVNVDVVVTDNRGNYVSGLKKENFRILEESVPQTITNFAPTDAPITMVLLIEFSKLGYEYFAYKSRIYAYEFLRQLNKDDWVALMSYDLKPRIEVDFTQNKSEVQSHLARMYFPGFSESNMFDAVIDVTERLEDVKGKKAILLMGSGLDTFSRKTLDDALKQLKQTDVTIFAVGVARDFWEYYDNRGLMSGQTRMSFLQAENQLGAFARITGGRAWFPRFDGEMPGIFSDVASALRNQYSLGYTPSKPAHDGKYRKIKVLLVGDDGNPLIIKDQHGKNVKYVVYAREGYTPPKAGVAD